MPNTCWVPGSVPTLPLTLLPWTPGLSQLPASRFSFKDPEECSALPLHSAVPALMDPLCLLKVERPQLLELMCAWGLGHPLSTIF